MLGTAATLLAAGCRQDMHNQPKIFPQRGSEFFADGRGARPQVENTVARGQFHEDGYFYTGFQGGKEGDGMPFPATMKVLERGQERYNIYCTPCHSRTGNGMGMIVDRGYARAANLDSFRLQNMPLGHFFNVISNGYGNMPDYSGQIVPEDRWAIVAYIKALQLSQNATQADVPAGVHPEPLSEVAQKEGLPASFADVWVPPATAATGTPDNEPFTLPTTAPPAEAGSAAKTGSAPTTATEAPKK